VEAETVAPAPEFVPPPAPPLTPRPKAEPALNFHNPVAVRIALLVAITATVLNFLPFLNWIAAGFFAVFFYRRKTGSLLDVVAGVRMGWITGLLTFAFGAVLFTIQLLPAALSGRLGNVFEQQLKNFPSQDPVVQQMIQFFHSGAGAATLVVFSLFSLFVFITGLSMAGGALGAKIVGKS
jgi:hypothetical protein